MSTTLPHGIIQINEGNIAWYGDITANWQLIDSKIGEYDAAIATIPAPANNGTLTINYGGTTLAMFGADDAQNVTADIPAPGDGTLTVTQGGSTLGTFSANQATPETIDIPALGNGTLTIQQNGTNVQTFTANASTNATANIRCVDLTSAQTIGGDKEFTGTTTAHDVVPSATDTYNFGSSTAQWNNAYIKSLTINGVACGDILTHNASEFVGVSGNQTISGDKTFYSLFSKSNTLARGSLPTTNINEDPIFIAADKNNKRTLAFFNYYNTNGDGRVVLYAYNQNTTNYDNVGLVFGFDNTNNSKSIHPVIANACNFGTSTNKWKDVNTVLLNGKTPAYFMDIPTKVSQLTNDSGFLTLESLDANSIPFHNAYPRCKYLGNSITDAQNTAIKNRTYDDLFIGDYWTINGVNWRIVAIDYYYNVGDDNFNFDKGNLIVMPDTVLYNAQMNTTDTTAGAYVGSLMRTQNLNNARTIAQNAFGSHLANHRIVLANSVDASGPNGWEWYDSDGVELPNEVQIYGTRVWGSALKGYDVGTQKQQFPLLALAPQFVNIRQNYWLQDVSSYSVSSAFAFVADNGLADYGYVGASSSFGVRPSVTLSYN